MPAHARASEPPRARRRGDRRAGTDHILLAVFEHPSTEGLLGVSLQQARQALDALDREALSAVGPGPGADADADARRAEEADAPMPHPAEGSPPLDARRATPPATLGSMSELSPQEHVDARVLAYYGSEFDEGDRLVGRSGQGVLEFERTQQIVGERVPAGAHIIDIGGASGLHAAALARRGDHVVLIDPVPRHVEAARRYGTFTAQLGDARSLPADDDSFDAAMLLGPLYHLCERSDRLRAWGEAIRVVRPGGWVFAAGISRLAAMAFVTVIGPSIELATSGRATSMSPFPDKWRRLIEEGAGDLGPNGFPGGHFHLADDLEEEALAAGLRDVRVIGVEGPGAQAIEISRSHDPSLIAAARTLAEAFESQPGLRDLSPHLLAMGRTHGP